VSDDALHESGPRRYVALLADRQHQTELRFGYTFAGLQELARQAVLFSRWQFLAFHEKYDIAWSAIAEEVYASEEAPRPYDLIRIGERAITVHVEDLGHTWGTYITGHHEREPGSGMPRLEMFWWTQAAPTPSPEERIIDVTALRQIWPRLNGVHQVVLLALATHGDYERAAEALDKPYKTFVTQIWSARKQFLRLWHQHEQPSGVWGHDRRKRSNPKQRSVTATTVRRRKARRLAKAAGSESTGAGGEPCS
jgi:hypothetical protein